MNESDAAAAKVAEFVAVTGCADAADAVACLTRCDWNLESAVGAFFGDEAAAETVRAPIAPREDVVLAREDIAALSGGPRRTVRPTSGFQQQRGGGAGRSAFDAFRNFREDAAAASAAGSDAAAGVCGTAKVHELATKFRPPVDLLVRGSLDDARAQAADACKQLLVNVQDVQEFVSHALNRDVWADPRVRQVVAAHFCVWQVLKDSDEGARFARLYRVERFPAVAVLDAISGECLLRCTVPSTVTQDLCDTILGELQDFVAQQAEADAGSLPATRSVPAKPRSVLDLTEEQQLAMAIGASLTETKMGSGGGSAAKPKEAVTSSMPSLFDSSSDEEDEDYGSDADGCESSCASEEEKEEPQPETKKQKKTPGETSIVDVAEPAAKPNPDVGEKCLLNIRHPDGKTIVGEFSGADTLAEVRSFIDANSSVPSGYKVVALCPRRVLSAGISLASLGLVPRSAVILELLS